MRTLNGQYIKSKQIVYEYKVVYTTWRHLIKIVMKYETSIDSSAVVMHLPYFHHRKTKKSVEVQIYDILTNPRFFVNVYTLSDKLLAC